jgi:hypothetical protein
MKRIGLLILIFLFLIVPVGVFAQSDAALASVLVELWPEYDRPSMLVINHIFLSSTIPLPYKMSLRIPAAAGDLHAVAARQNDGVLVTIPFEKTTEKDWTVISFQATSVEIQLEYYDTSIQLQGNSRSFIYTWPGDFSVGELSLDVQQPVDAQNLQIIPGMATPQVREDGLTYYHTVVGPLTKGQSFEIKVQYQKSTDTLSVSDLPVAPSAPLDASTTGAISISSVLPWALGLIGLALMIGGGVWYWRSGHQKAQPEKRTRSRKSSGRPVNVANEDEVGRIYCPQCGKRASDGDRFCRVCGAPLR